MCILVGPTTHQIIEGEKKTNLQFELTSLSPQSHILKPALSAFGPKEERKEASDLPATQAHSHLANIPEE